MLVDDECPEKVEIVALEDANESRLFEVEVQSTSRLLFSKIPTIAV